MSRTGHRFVEVGESHGHKKEQGGLDKEAFGPHIGEEVRSNLIAVLASCF